MSHRMYVRMYIMKFELCSALIIFNGFIAYLLLKWFDINELTNLKNY